MLQVTHNNGPSLQHRQVYLGTENSFLQLLLQPDA